MAIIITRDGTELKGAGNVTSISAESKRIVNVADPTSNQDVATKAYVDNSAGAATNALDGTFTIDNTVDPTKQIDFDASGIATGTVRTITMPNADVNLGLVSTAVQSSEKGAANGVATLDAGGKLSAGQVPAIAITDTFVVASQAAMLALSTAQTGDVAVRTDLNKSFILAGADYATLGDWQELLSPTDAVLSVNGITGVVVLDSDDISEGASNFYYTEARFDSSFSGKSTSDLSEGTNLYFTVARVLASALTGLSVADSSAVSATDTVLQAIGKLQARSILNNMVASVDPSANDDIGDGYENGSLWYNTVSNQLFVLEDATLTAAVWQDITADQAVTSVNSQTGAVVLDSDDISEGASNLYYTEARFDSSLAAKDTGDLAEGTNLYFTDARAKSAAVADAIADGVTDVAPSQNAVFDALAAKAEASDSGRVFDDGVAGEAFAINQVYLVRRAKVGETAGRYYKAQADSFANSRVVGYVVVGAVALAAADPIRVYKFGEQALGSADTAFGAGNINSPVYLHQSTAGKFTIAPATTSGSIIKPVGYVGADAVIEFQPDTAVQA